MVDRDAKDELFAAFARVARALGNGHRAEIVDVLAQGERSVESLADEIGQSVANTSQHLQVLARAGLVRPRRAGTRVFYALADDEVGALWDMLRTVAARHVVEVELLARDLLGPRDDLEHVTAAELAARLAEGRVVVLDVRPAAEYAAGHITGARHAPLDELTDLASALSSETDVIAYCRGAYCVYADDAVRILRARGVPARRLDVGFPEWRRADLPVTVPG